MILSFQDALMALALAGGATVEPEVAIPGGVLAPERLLVSSSSLDGSGGLFAVRGPAPYAVKALAPTDASRHLRRFGSRAYAVSSVAGTIWEVPLGPGASRVFDLGPDSQPQDLFVRGPQSTHAYLTLRNDPALKQLDLRTGALSDVVDLSFLGLGAGIALGTMERDGSRLFVQVKIFAPTPLATEVFDTGALAVLDMNTNTLLDADANKPGVQAVALFGAPPQLKMQRVDATRTLFVSSTEGALDGRGAIEMVDLDTLSSAGFAVSEQQLADLGGFVMVSDDVGYLVFHTDLAASTHLKRFTLSGGVDPGPELLVFLGDSVDRLSFDKASGRVYLPSGFATGPPLVHALDVASNRVLPDAISVGQPVGDVLPLSKP